MQSNTEADRVKQAQMDSITWTFILKTWVSEAREMAGIVSHVLMKYILPALVVSGFVVGGVMLFFTLIGFA